MRCSKVTTYGTAIYHSVVCRELEARALAAHSVSKQSRSPSSSPNPALASPASRESTAIGLASSSFVRGESPNTQMAAAGNGHHVDSGVATKNRSIHSDMVDVPLADSPTVSGSAGYSRMA